jgi:simple sugar transport system ATP-binding protein/ribose transport system ATP-binding protein
VTAAAPAAERDIHVALQGIGKRFGGVQALTDIDLEIERGTIHGLVGENGAGKSTLGKIIAGVHRPDDGQLWVDGSRVSYHSPRAALRGGLTIITQEPTLVPNRSVLENVFLGTESAAAGVLDTRATRRRYAELAERAQIELPSGALARALRVADQQKVEVLRALAREARLIVMDEPTSALTTDEASRLFDLVRRLREDGTTIIYVSHFLEEVLALVDMVTVLRDGRLVRTETAAQETPERLVTAMLGRSREIAFPEKVFPPLDAPVALSVQSLSNPPGVHEVSFEIRSGEILGLCGLIGSGRSEVARAIFGADKRSSGTIEVGGRPVRIRSPRGAIGSGVAMLPEDRKAQGLLMLRSIVDNVTLPHLATVSRSGVLAPRRERRSVVELMRRIDVRARGPSSKLMTLSGGNQQKVLFAKWLFRPPRVFIADEPTRGVDVGAKLAIHELIHSLAAEGKAVLLISSEHEEVLGLAHRVLVMRGGRIVAELDGPAMTEDAVLHAAFATERTSASDERTA